MFRLTVQHGENSASLDKDDRESSRQVQRVIAAQTRNAQSVPANG
jgi:hypothetical protein